MPANRQPVPPQDYVAVREKVRPFQAFEGSLSDSIAFNREQVIEECEYYCLDTLIATLKEKLEEEKNPQVERLLPPKLPTKPRLDGVYEGNESIIFIDHERFIMSKVSKGPRAGISVWNPTAAVLVFANCFPLPQIWIDSARAMHFGATDTQMAALATETVIRGKYSVDETGKMTLLVGQNSTRFGFLSQNHQLVTFDIQNSLYSEETFTFCAFTR